MYKQYDKLQSLWHGLHLRRKGLFGILMYHMKTRRKVAGSFVDKFGKLQNRGPEQLINWRQSHWSQEAWMACFWSPEHQNGWRELGKCLPFIRENPCESTRAIRNQLFRMFQSSIFRLLKEERCQPFKPLAVSSYMLLFPRLLQFSQTIKQGFLDDPVFSRKLFFIDECLQQCRQ